MVEISLESLQELVYEHLLPTPNFSVLSRSSFLRSPRSAKP